MERHVKAAGATVGTRSGLSPLATIAQHAGHSLAARSAY
jgi:hypothetical protein